MKFSTRSTYGLRAMIALAKTWDKKNAQLPLSRIAQDERISLKYLERIFNRLKKAGLVTAEKGSSGGYRLLRDPAKITAYEIIQPLEGQIATFHCLDEQGKAHCVNSCHCGANPVLTRVQFAVSDTLKSITLKDLI